MTLLFYSVRISSGVFKHIDVTNGSYSQVELRILELRGLRLFVFVAALANFRTTDKNLEQICFLAVE